MLKAYSGFRPSRSQHDDADAPRLATLVEISPEGPRVRLHGEGVAVCARSIVPRSELDGRDGCDLLVTRVSSEWIVTGIVQDFSQAPSSAPPATIAGIVEADGKQVVIRAAERIVFRCGQSSLVMRADGHIVVRGNHVETRARRLNRIRGGSVKVN